MINIHELEKSGMFWIFLLLILPTIGLAQKTQTFKFKDEQGPIDKEPISVSLYQSNGKIEIKSDRDGKVALTEEQISDADSIFVSYGFYNLKVEKFFFNSNPVFLTSNIALKEVVVKAREVEYIGPEKQRYPFQVSNNFFALISIPVNEIKDAEITGIRYNFKSWSPFFSGKSDNKRFKVLLYGFNEIEHIELVNLLEQEIEVQIPAKVPDWVKVSLREYEIKFKKYKYLAIGFLPLDNGIIIKQSDEKYYPNYHDLQVINFGEKIKRVRVFEPTENRINVQLITEK